MMAAAIGLKKTPEYLASADACRLRRGGDVGAATRFPPNNVPWNKGKQHPATGRSASTQFKTGQMPHNTRGIGEYRLVDGLLQQKVSNAKGSASNRWRGVHELVWVEANGPVPPGHLCVFKPGMSTSVLTEITHDKVECISRSENMRRNSYHNYGPEIARVVQLRGAITRQINQRIKRHGQEHL